MGHLVGLSLSFLIELRENPLDVHGVLASLVEVLLYGALGTLIGSVLAHLLLALYKAVFGVVDLAQLVDEELLRVADRYISRPSFACLL